ncbi:MAG TPA: response regulator transcription factor [Candidatus Dormibacteraeota bacterium]|nr:response regulator transcription factor [Candidatus Dormibacteraeota bacterium]
MIRVVVADDHPVVRQGLSTMLEVEADLLVVGQAADGREAVETAVLMEADVVLMDVQMPGVNGIEALRTLRRTRPATRVIMLTTYDQEAYVIPSLRAGSYGYLLKDVDRAVLVEAIRRVARGESLLEAWQSPVAARLAAASDDRRGPATPGHGPAQPGQRLTARELEVLACVAQEMSNRAVGQRLFISENTVKTHVRNILTKLEVGDRAAAVLRAWRQGLLPGEGVGHPPPG